MPDERNMNIEANRLASFQNWPSDAPVRPTPLAKAGFYYYGQSDEVKCFSCRGRVLQWAPGDDPMNEHRRHFPNCPFLISPSSTGNVPLTSQSGSVFSSRDLPDNVRGITGGINEMNIQPHRPILPTPGLSQGTSVGKQAVQGNSISNLPNVFYSNVPIPFNREEMRFEQKRLDTLNDWPKKDRIDPKLVAASGLFFVGPGDKLKCAFCNGAMMNWDTGDHPGEEHFKYFGDRCPLAKGEPTDNVPINPDDSNQAGPRNTFDLLNIVTERPKYPDYAVLAVRETTFRNWPKEDVQSFKRLSAAGFYYTGNGDQVRCFFCGGGLKNWDSSDDPWVEHAKWFHNCGFIRQMKGSDFIHQVKRTQALIKSNETQTEEGGFDRRMVTAAMALPVTQAVLKMGFSETLVRDAIETKLRATGENYKNATELTEVVLARQGSGPPPAPAAQPSMVGGKTTMILQEEEAAMEENQTVQSLGAEEVAAAIKKAEATAMEDDEETPESMEQGQGGSDSGRPTLMSRSAKRRKRRNKKKQEKLAKEMAMRSGSCGAESLESDITPETKDKLEKENQQLKDQRLCKICLDKDCSVVFLPCGHMCACESCAERLRKCPICNGPIRGTVKAFLA